MTRTLRVSLVTLGDPETLSGGYLYHLRLASLAAQHGANMRFISFPQRPFPVPAMSAWRVLDKVKEAGTNIIVLDSIAAAYVSPLSGVIAGKSPVAGMLHQPPGGIDHGPVRTKIQAWLDTRVYHHQVSRLLAASQDLADNLEQRGFVRERITVVPPGRDVAPGLGKPAGDLRRGRKAAFLCVANWVKRKDIESLLDAFARLPGDAGTLHLVGDSEVDKEYAGRVWKRLERNDLRSRVSVRGRLDVGDVASLYAAADVFVLPSLSDPYGTVYGEAMAMGLPVVGWRAGNLPHLADHEREGLILEPGDIAGLSQALQRLSDDEPFRRAMAEAAKRRASTRPTWNDTAGLFFDTLREVVARGA